LLAALAALRCGFYFIFVVLKIFLAGCTAKRLALALFLSFFLSFSWHLKSALAAMLHEHKAHELACLLGSIFLFLFSLCLSLLALDYDEEFKRGVRVCVFASSSLLTMNQRRITRVIVILI
jgi:hypothetical protein